MWGPAEGDGGIVGDTNPYVIGLYSGLRAGAISVAEVVGALRTEPELMRWDGEKHY